MRICLVLSARGGAPLPSSVVVATALQCQNSGVDRYHGTSPLVSLPGVFGGGVGTIGQKLTDGVNAAWDQLTTALVRARWTRVVHLPPWPFHSHFNTRRDGPPGRKMMRFSTHRHGVDMQ